MSLRSILKYALVDVAPLRSNTKFRRFWLAQAVSSVGSQMGVFAVALQVYRVTHSAFAVGAVGVFAAVPMLSLGMFGGTIADSFDRRRLLLVTGGLSTALSGIFALQAFASADTVLAVYPLVAAQAAIGAIQVPARRSIVPSIVAREELPAAVTLGTLSLFMAQVIGPLVAGVIVASTQLGVCYAVNAASFLIATYAVFRLAEVPRPSSPTASRGQLVREAIEFILGSPILKATFAADLSLTVLGLPTALMPVINGDFFDGDPRSLGLLLAATAAGGVVGSLLSGFVRNAHRPGRAMLSCCAVWGGLAIGFAMSRSLVLSVPLLVVMGAMDALAVTFCNVIAQTVTPDEVQGRVVAAEWAINVSGPQVGGLRAGAVASLTSPATSVIIGGICAVAGVGVIVLRLPQLVGYRAARRGECDPEDMPVESTPTT